jgi:hypothetical protein
MKRYLQTLIILLSLASAFLHETKAQTRVTKNIKNFNAIKVGGGVDLYLTQGESEFIQIEAAPEVLEEIITESDGDYLVIRLNNLKGKLKNLNKPVKAYVTFVELKSIQAGGGSDVFGQGNLNFRNLLINASGGSDVKLNLNANELEVKVSGGSDVVLEGYSAYFKGYASGGSDIKGAELQTEVSEVNCSGGSDIKIKVSRELIGSATGGSDITYFGTPEKVSTRSSGGSDIHRRDNKKK